MKYVPVRNCDVDLSIKSDKTEGYLGVLRLVVIFIISILTQ